METQKTKNPATKITRSTEKNLLKSRFWPIPVEERELVTIAMFDLRAHHNRFWRWAKVGQHLKNEFFG